MNLFKEVAKDPHMTKEPLDFVEKEKIRLVDEEFDIKRIFEASFDLEGTKRPFAIIEAIDGSYHSILEVQPIKYNSLEPILQKEIQREYFNFLSNVDFPLIIIKRVVNSNTKNKISALLNRIEYKLKLRKSNDLLKSFKPVSTFVTNLSKRLDKKTKKYYIVVSFKPSLKTKKDEGERAKKILAERIIFIISSLKKARLNNIIPLTQDMHYNLFFSYIKDYLYDGSVYLTPTNWLQQFYRGAEND